MHNVLFALDTHLAARLRLRHGARLDEVVERHDLGLDETLLKVGVNDAGSLGGRPALTDGPGAGLFGAGGEVGLKTQGIEPDSGELVEAALVLSCRSEQ